MLIDFKVKNFKSFKEETDFSMVKGKAKSKSERTREFKNFSALKFSSLFGANASGKSNLIQALRLMKILVLNNVLPSDAINEYYRLDDSYRDISTYFETIISIDERIYSYGFEVSLVNNHFSSEWLVELIKTRDGKERQVAIFEREGNQIKLSPSLLKKEKHIVNRLNIYKEDSEMNPAMLFLHHLNDAKNALFETDDEEILVLRKTYEWFRDQLVIINPNEPFTSPNYFASEPKLKKLVNLLKGFDTGIANIVEVDSTEEEFIRKNHPLQLDAIKDMLIKQRYQLNTSNNPMDFSVMIRNNIDFWIIVITAKGEFKYKRLVFLHDENTSHDFSLQDESDGTLRIFDLAEVLLCPSSNKTFLIDELDRCLHPSLTVQFVKLFLNMACKEEYTNQLIVTTHESRLLDLNILRRDEIWFVSKEKNISRIYSLEEYNERFDKVIDKAYLEGRYGGIPIFESIYFPEYIKNENSKK